MFGVLGFSQDSITTKKRLKIDGVSACRNFIKSTVYFVVGHIGIFLKQTCRFPLSNNGVFKETTGIA